MKKLLVIGLLVLVCTNASAGFNFVFHRAVIVLKNGEQIECLAKYPAMYYSEFIKYRTDINGKTQKIRSEDIERIRYFFDNGGFVEKVFLRYIKASDVSKGRLNRSGPDWMELIVDGPMKLYVKETVTHQARRRGIKRYYYYCIREGENVATEITRTGSEIGFSKHAPAYFADNLVILNNIRNKEKGYSVRDIKAIVLEYNAGNGL